MIDYRGMRGIPRAIRFRRSLRRQARDEVAAEIAFHLDHRTDELVRSGMAEPAARAQAAREFGDAARAERALRRAARGTERRVRLAEMMDTVRRELAHSIRGLVRSPVLSATILLTVGLGIGATSAMLSVVNAVILRPLPYPHAERLVRVYTDVAPNRWPFSVVDYRALEAQQTSFSAVAGYTQRSMIFTDGQRADRVDAVVVTPSYFCVLGLAADRGRLLDAGDAVPGREAAVVVSHAFWRRVLGGDPDAIGRTIHLSGRPHLVVGVLGESAGPLEGGRDLFVAAQWDEPERRGPFFVRVIGSLRDDIGADAALAELRTINARIYPLWSDTYDNRETSWGLVGLKEMIVGETARTLWFVLAAAVLVLVIACVNAASLLLARYAQRARELAIRAAIGASRRRLLGHLWAESVLLASAGAALGLAIAAGAVRVLSTVGRPYLPRSAEIGLDGWTLGVVAATAAGSALLFGLLPCVHGVRFRFETTLRSGGRSGSGAPRARRARRALVVAQIAIAVPLLVASGLLLASLIRLQAVDPGFEADDVLTVAISLPAAEYPDGGAVSTFWAEARPRLVGIPGVVDAGLANARSPDRFPMSNDFELIDRPLAPGAAPPTAPWISATPDYFSTLGVSLIEGRLFDERDLAEDAPPVLIVDRSWVDRHLPEGDAVGRQLIEGGCAPPVCPLNTIVGVVDDVVYTGLDALTRGTVYWPVWLTLSASQHTAYLFVRTDVDPVSVLPAVRQAIRSVDASLPLSDAATARDVLDRSLATPRSVAVAVAGFAGISLLLSLIGLYGVMANFVQIRARDIGIRLALGARPRTVVRHIVLRGLALAAAGVAVGLALIWSGAGVLTTALFQVAGRDPTVYLLVCGIMLTAATVACVLPARRAAAVDPARTLRAD